MSMVKCAHMFFSYPGMSVFENANFQINPGEKVGIVGNNGAGKTTLFKLITGELVSDSGEVAVPKGSSIGYMVQHPEFAGDETLFDELDGAFEHIHAIRRKLYEIEHEMSMAPEKAEQLNGRYGDLLEEFEKAGGYNVDFMISRVLIGVGFTKEDYPRKICNFSGGEKSRALLAKLLVSNADILLLDEPTNHLDIRGISWLEEYLSGYEKTVLIISHDRYFLDKIVTRIVEIENSAVKIYKGNYSAYVKQKTEEIAVQEKLYTLQKADIERKEEFIRRNIAGQKTKQAKSRIIELDKMKKLTPPSKRIRYNLAFPEGQRGGNDVLAVEHLAKSFANKQVIGDFSLKVQRGERIGVVGPNGSGKTTLLKMIIGQLAPDAGVVRIGSGVEPGYYAQNLENQTPENTVIEEVWQADPSKTEQEMRGILGRFLFYGDEVYARIEMLSGGERSRVELAKLILSGVNFLILDEPTNHLDIFAKMALEEALASFAGTILVVSHDRYFLDRIATRIVYFDNGNAMFIEGNYSAFEQRKKELDNVADKKPASQDKTEYLKRKKESRAKERSTRKRDIAEIEREIAEVEKILKEYDLLMSEPDFFVDYENAQETSRKYDEYAAQLDALYTEWEESQ